MPNINIRIKNLPQIQAAFKRAPYLMTRNLNLAIRWVATNIQRGEVQQYHAYGIRIITRGLIKSIERGIYYGNLKAEVGPNVTGSPGVEYAAYVHSGTRYMKARPFLKVAVEGSEHETDMAFTQAVQKTLNEIGRSV